jgi:flagellar biosynthesis/type III secretory pathway protein FliH
VTIPKLAGLLEVKKMIAEHAIDWTKEWKDLGRAEGLAEGHEKALQELRQIARKNLEARFGALPPTAQERLSALESVEALGTLIARSATAPSLAELDLL